jgi:hypothetical protein
VWAAIILTLIFGTAVGVYWERWYPDNKRVISTQRDGEQDKQKPIEKPSDPFPVSFLKTAVGKPRDEIAKTLGPPRQTLPLDAGGSVWSYSFTEGGMFCRDYVLTFNKAKSLVDWQGREDMCPRPLPRD